MVAVRYIGLSVHNPSGNARLDPPPQMTTVSFTLAAHDGQLPRNGGRSRARKARIAMVISITSAALYRIFGRLSSGALGVTWRLQRPCAGPHPQPLSRCDRRGVPPFPRACRSGRSIDAFLAAPGNPQQTFPPRLPQRERGAVRVPSGRGGVRADVATAMARALGYSIIPCASAAARAIIH